MSDDLILKLTPVLKRKKEINTQICFFLVLFKLEGLFCSLDGEHTLLGHQSTNSSPNHDSYRGFEMSD